MRTCICDFGSAFSCQKHIGGPAVCSLLVPIDSAGACQLIVSKQPTLQPSSTSNSSSSYFAFKMMLCQYGSLLDVQVKYGVCVEQAQTKGYVQRY